MRDDSFPLAGWLGGVGSTLRARSGDRHERDNVTGTGGVRLRKTMRIAGKPTCNAPTGQVAGWNCCAGASHERVRWVRVERCVQERNAPLYISSMLERQDTGQVGGSESERTLRHKACFVDSILSRLK